MKIPAFSCLATFAAIAVGTATASQHAAIDLDTGDIDASSQLGSLIMSKARALNNNNNNNNNVYYTWVSGYSIKFQQCFASSNYYGGYFGGNQNGNNDKNNNRNGFNGMYEQRLVHFKLCPSSSCSSSCENGADYVVDMNEFVNAYVESKLSVQEYNCERVRENCYCQNANNEQYCQSMCYQNAGLDYCGQYQNGGNNNNNNNNNKNNGQFNLQEALECRKLEVDENAMQYYLYKNGGNLNDNAQNYYNYNQKQDNKMELFVGPYCANNGKKILLGVFMEETCSYAAPSGIYEKLFYGNKLPYSSDSLVTNSCVDCKEPDNYNNKNNNDQQDADNILDVCQRLYEDAGKCESSLSNSIPYPNTYACDFIKTLPKVSTWSISKSAAVPAKALAGVFAVTTVAFGALTVFLHKKVTAKGGLAQGLSPTDAELA